MPGEARASLGDAGVGALATDADVLRHLRAKLQPAPEPVYARQQAAMAAYLMFEFHERMH